MCDVRACVRVCVPSRSYRTFSRCSRRTRASNFSSTRPRSWSRYFGGGRSADALNVADTIVKADPSLFPPTCSGRKAAAGEGGGKRKTFASVRIELAFSQSFANAGLALPQGLERPFKAIHPEWDITLDMLRGILLCSPSSLMSYLSRMLRTMFWIC